MSSMGSILRNPDRWKWFSEDLETKEGILSRPGRNQGYDRLHPLRGTRGGVEEPGERRSLIKGSGGEGSRGTKGVGDGVEII
jgi:hypothetical protein